MAVIAFLRPFSYLYDKMLLWSSNKHASFYLAGVSFAESSFFPIPPDIMLITMGLAKPRGSWRFAWIATLFSVLGGMLGFVIGRYGISLIEPYILASSYAASYQKVHQWFEQSGVLTVILASFTPFPYKLFTITAGALQVSFFSFVLGSLLGRGLRFYLVSGLLYWKGAQLEKQLRKIADYLGWGLLLTVMVFYLVACGDREVLAPVVDSHWNVTNLHAGTHRVLKKETLYSIAFRYETDYRQLAAMNHIQKPYLLHVGQVLQIRSFKTFVPVLVEPAHSVVQTGLNEKVWYAKTRSSVGKLWQWPAVGHVISAYAPLLGRKGITIAGSSGERIFASRKGVVAYAGSGIAGYGQLILIKHDHQFLTAYGHNATILVKEGQAVRKGQVIAKMGAVNRHVFGVHFEIRRLGRPVNPMSYL
jgi:lipoprotein NlpD